MPKRYLTSKTLWVNTLAFTFFLIQFFTGWVVPPEWQAFALTAINYGLRLVTKDPVVWGG